MTALDRALIRAFQAEPGAAPSRAKRLAGATVGASSRRGGARRSAETKESALPALSDADLALAAIAAATESITCAGAFGSLHVAQVGADLSPAGLIPVSAEVSLTPPTRLAGKRSATSLRFDSAHTNDALPALHVKTAVQQPASLPPATERPPAEAPPAVARRPLLGVFADEPPLADAPQAAAASAARPLSSLLTRPSAEPFRPLLEVDNFIWSPEADLLASRAAAEIAACAKKLLSRAAGGQKVIAISGARRGQGRTTIIAALARQMAQNGANVVVVDADLANPQLAARLGIAAQAGWDDVADGNLPLAESLIVSLADRFTLAPLREPLLTADAVAGNLRATLAFGTLREHFDLVLVDAGPILSGNEGLLRLARSLRLDAAYLVDDARTPDAEVLQQAIASLEEAGVAVAGLMENFGAAPAAGTGPQRTEKAQRHTARSS